MRRFFMILPLLLALAACASATKDLEGPTVPLGDFRLGHVGVVAPNLQKLLVSRDVTKDEWIAEMTDALGTRFSRFDGDKYYHLGVSVEAYSLPPPVVPGKSAVALNVTLWDDAAQAKMNPEPKQVQVIKVFESRISKNRDEQLTGLAEEAARQVEVWLREMQEAEGWFEGAAPPDAQPAALPDDDAVLDAPQRQAVTVPPEITAITNAASPAPRVTP